MTLSVIADVHLANHARFGGLVRLGLNARAEIILAAMERAVEAAAPGHLFVLGDLFDVAKPEPSLIAAAQRVFSERPDVRVHLLVGNHDQTSESPGNHAMAPLRPVAQVYDSPAYLVLDGLGVLVVPFPAPMAQALDEAITVHASLGNLQARPWVLLGHWGISSPTDPPYMREGRDVVSSARLSELAAEFPTLLGVAAGNWHGRFVVPLRGTGCPALQVGALAPTGWDNPGLDGYGTIASWAGSGWAWQEVCGPRFCTTVEHAQKATKGGHAAFLRLRVPAAGVEAARAQASDLTLAGYAVEVQDDVDVRVAARTAAAAARSSGTLAASLAAFVAQMPLPADVRRDAVLDRAAGYLQGTR